MKTVQKWKIGDCLDLLPEIPDKSIDLILTDLPYGVTRNKWDTPIDLLSLWNQYNRIIKDRGTIVLTATQPFSTNLINSNFKLFRYEIIWDKKHPKGFLNANRRPLTVHESILVFYKKLGTYNPQKTKGRYRNKRIGKTNNGCYGEYNPIDNFNDEYYPTSILTISSADQHNKVNSTQKPLKLFEYLIKTYTNEGDWVHDSCLGSGTTLEACMNTNRNCIGFEIDPKHENHYFERLKRTNHKLDSFD